MFKKARVVLLVTVLMFAFASPVMAQDEGPVPTPASGEVLEETGEPGDIFQTLEDFLEPVIGLVGKVIVIVTGLAWFLMGTVVGTNVLKTIVLFKVERWEWYMKVRPGLIRALSFFVAVFFLAGSNVDLFGMLKEISEVYEINPVFAQFISGGPLSLAANWVYDNKIKKDTPAKITHQPTHG